MYKTILLQVAAGLSFTVFLTSHGNVYTCGTNSHGQLGHGDTVDRPTPKVVELLESVVQIAAGPSYVLSITEDGIVHSFGSGTNFCLGHGEQQNELRPRAIQLLKKKGLHIVRVSAGDEHVVALDSRGHVSPLSIDIPFDTLLCGYSSELVIVRCILGAKATVVHWAMEMRLIK